MRRLIREFLFSASEIGLMLLAWRNLRGFFAHPARAGVVVVLVITPFITYWGESERMDRGVRPVGGQWRTLFLLELGFFVCYWAVPYFDRRGLLVFAESNALRYAGLAIFAVGVALRVWAYLYLGRFFSVFLTIQRDHRLITDNIYSYVRHPSYTGLLIRSLGTALVFRSIFGLGAWLVLVVCILRRIRHEERVLASEFASDWENYTVRTPGRLIPGIY
ncbi:MAG: hypothetical protein QOJ64_3816 [Acidobacteriota bacterium]|jgi:protein-S-isoprenylcysteine O-methyltransferase Ste14|nr:hypothetical protein [Acidobacteriota bacterium]